MKHALVGKSANISAKIQLFYNNNKKTAYYNCNTATLLRIIFSFLWQAEPGDVYTF